MVNAAAMTEWRGIVGNFTKAMKNDPQAWDFAMRTGSINATVLRQLREQLVAAGRGGEVAAKRLEQLGFIKLDSAARVGGSASGEDVC